MLANGRPFDLYDLVANVVGSLGAIGLCSVYQKRMLERRRMARFGVVGGDASDNNNIELGLGGQSRSDGGGHDGATGLGPQENGVLTLEQEVDRFDENAVDSYDTNDGFEEADSSGHESEFTPTAVHADVGGEKKRSD